MWNHKWFNETPSRRVLLSYIVDFILILLIIAPYPLFHFMRPYERLVFRDDPSIRYPYTQSELVPTWSLALIVLVLPTTVITCWLGCQKFRRKRLFVAFLGLFLALALATQITNIVKNLTGRARPDFLDRCDPDPAIQDRMVCRGPKVKVEEGRRSFPSGHTSTSFAGLGYLALFIAGQTGLFDGQGNVWPLIVSGAPLLLATFIGLSRVSDYRHHWSDGKASIWLSNSFSSDGRSSGIQFGILLLSTVLSSIVCSPFKHTIICSL